MSKYAEIETTIRSEKYLNEALLLLGFKPEMHQNGATCQGYSGETSRAHVIVRKAGPYSTDIGFARQQDGSYKAVIDADGSMRVSTPEDKTGRYMGASQFLGLVNQRYAEVRTVAQAKLKGYKLASREQTADGKIRLVFGARTI